ncbi:ATP-binding cassette domain-containing protein [Mycoplasmopsis anatis]|uniref:ATP-binding cassette domain-containing protein n=2 Tax=Mycoplasmopsis anatis TaxID=171279 RepID=UPI001C4DEE4D|nr:ABC transporter ATP-binding protein [Mycoplasmopsis anatis]MBW0603411.1 ABC transporter ATP-binding protein [Mycoplasmopsis anatis]
MKYLFKLKGISTLIFILLLVIFCIEFIVSYFYGVLIQNLTYSLVDQSVKYLLIYLGILVISLIISFIYSIFKNKLDAKLNSYISKKVYISYANLKLCQSSKYDKNDWFYILTNAPFKYVDEYILQIFALLKSILSFLAILIAASIISPITLSYTLPVFGLYLAVIYLFRSNLNKIADLEKTLYTVPMCESKKYIEYLFTSSINSQSEQLVHSYSNSLEKKIYNKINSLSNIYSIYVFIMQSFALLYTFVILSLSMVIWVVNPLLITIASLSVLMTKFFDMNSYSASIVNSLTSINVSKKVFKDVLSKVNLTDKKLLDAEVIQQKSGFKFNSIELKNVSLSVENKDILKNINLKINKNQKILITGASGSGKSTLIKLLTGHYENITSGTVLLNDKEVPNLENLQICSFLTKTQMNFFEGNILENLTLENNENSKVEELLKIFNLEVDTEEEIIDKDPEFSTGQNQRLALIQALISQKEVLLFDESFSNIDKENFDVILPYILSLDKTIIIISHTLNNKYLNKFDKLINIKNGEINEA